MKKLFKIALEDDTSGNTEIEKELVFYARIESIAPLMAAAESIESQNQFQLRIHASGAADATKLPRLRVRATKQHDQTEIVYTQTLKVPVGSGKKDGDRETTIIISEDFFNEFKLMADSHMTKDRYTIKIEGQPEKWEVDVFYNEESGRAYNWVKCDYEFKSKDANIPALPDYMTDIIAGTTTDPKERAFIDELYEKVFLKKTK